MEKALHSPPIDATEYATRAWRDVEIGGGNGHGNGRPVAKILSALSLGGTLDGVQFLSPKAIDKIFVQQAYGEDLVVGLKLRIGTGFGLPAKARTGTGSQ